ncbi:uncharacterized protein LOC115696583 [Cannabis sativa]|uniref:uncharacterized protein LOC115696583 n=1 Tax=Cannabis sativa TaxID=3483 RepID=UPI0029CA73EA|nr:uncharacterized protein LOC115696583 [Cannabis sativa]
MKLLSIKLILLVSSVSSWVLVLYLVVLVVASTVSTSSLDLKGFQVEEVSKTNSVAAQGIVHLQSRFLIAVGNSLLFAVKMEMFREGGSTSRPPMLEGANYPYWKTKMRAFLRAIDERLKVIANCEIAKEAWEKLKIKNDGTDAVKKSRLRALAKAFENLTMEEDQSVADFHAKLWKKTKKQKDVVKDKSDASIALIHQENKKPVLEELNGIADETVALVTRNYAKFLKKNYRRNFPADKENSLKKNKGAECANTLKKKKALAATWSDSEEEKNSTASEGSDEDKQVLAFMARSRHPVESKDDAVSASSEADSVGRQNAYEEMFTQWEYMTKQIRGLKSSLEQVETEKGKLEDTFKNLNRLVDEKENEIYKLIPDLIRTKQALQFIPPGTTAINQTLQLQKPYGDRTSLGYKILYKQGNDLFVENSLPSNVDSTKKEDERGHIRPKCYKLQNYLKAMFNRPNSFPQPNKSHGRKPCREWKMKSKPNPSVGLVAKLSLSAFVEGQWYLDSGCSRHMTGNKKVLVNYKDEKGES